MDIIDFYRMEQKRVHNWLRRSISDLAGWSIADRLHPT